MGRTKGRLQEQQQLDVEEGNVVSIKRGRGRPSGVGYDPGTGQEHHAETDVFAFTGAKGYRPDRFYTRSTNNDGHGEKMQVRVPQGIDSQIAAAVRETKQYRTNQDFWRDAAVHRLEWLQKNYELGEVLERLLEMERHYADIQELRLEAQTMQDIVEGLDQEFQFVYDNKDWGAIAQMLAHGDDMMEWMKDPYQGYVVAILRSWRNRTKEDVEKWRKNQE